MAKAGIRFTYEDYVNLPEDKRYEILEGELYMVPAPNIMHQRILRNLGNTLWDFVKQHDLGEVLYAPADVLLSEEDVVQPDILFVSKNRLAIFKEQYVKGGPDLVVEILSTSTEKRDRTVKRKIYGKAGVRELWFVDLEARTIEILVNEGKGFQRKQTYAEGTSLRSPLLPGLELDVREVFEV